MRASSPTTEDDGRGDEPGNDRGEAIRHPRGPAAPLGPDGEGRPEGIFADRPSGILDLSASHHIGEVVYRQRAQVGGRIRSVRVRPWGEILTLEAVIADATGAITVAFGGRRSVAGIAPGGWLSVEGMVGERNEKLVILNPAYDLRPLDR